MTGADQAAPYVTGRAQPDGHRNNAFGFLRLVLASLVIVSHVPQLIDGNADREALYYLTGAFGFGGMAVNGFFLISGYLVTSSFHNQPSAVAYLARRIARILPGFLVASLFCIMVVAPISGVGAAVIAENRLTLLRSILTLQEPILPGTFAGTYYPSLNGSMWTIFHEFRCYLLVLVLGGFGVFRWRALVPLAAALLMLGYVILAGAIDAPALRQEIAGLPFDDISNVLRLTAIFLVGTTFYLYRSEIRLTLRGAAVAACLLAPMLFVPVLAEPAFAVLGGYLLFAVGFGVQSGPLTRINSVNDISYGVYLYAWPLAKLLLLAWPGMPMVLCMLLDFVLACLCGWLSWLLIEKPAMAWTKGERSRTTPIPASR